MRDRDFDTFVNTASDAAYAAEYDSKWASYVAARPADLEDAAARFDRVIRYTCENGDALQPIQPLLASLHRDMRSIKPVNNLATWFRMALADAETLACHADYLDILRGVVRFMTRPQLAYG